jgi:EDD domain protein, DegV family
MKIVTDSGTDVFLTEKEREALNISVVPLIVTLRGKSYFEGVEITPEVFYPLLFYPIQEQSLSLPQTSMPSPGKFADIYRRLAEQDPSILSIHMSSGLSGTYNASITGAELVPEARINHIDTKTLSAAAGWQVVAAARALASGKDLDYVRAMLQAISAATESLYTLDDLKFLIHGGRISHMKALIASVLSIKPVIGVEKVHGTYVQKGQARSFKGGLREIVNTMLSVHPEGTPLVVQPVHALNPEGVAALKDLLAQAFPCTFLPDQPISLALGAHTGPSMVGVAYATAADLQPYAQFFPEAFPAA